MKFFKKKRRRFKVPPRLKKAQRLLYERVPPFLERNKPEISMIVYDVARLVIFKR